MFFSLVFFVLLTVCLSLAGVGLGFASLVRSGQLQTEWARDLAALRRRTADDLARFRTRLDALEAGVPLAPEAPVEHGDDIAFGVTPEVVSEAAPEAFPEVEPEANAEGVFRAAPEIQYEPDDALPQAGNVVRKQPEGPAVVPAVEESEKRTNDPAETNAVTDAEAVAEPAWTAFSSEPTDGPETSEEVDAPARADRTAGRTLRRRWAPKYSSGLAASRWRWPERSR